MSFFRGRTHQLTGPVLAFLVLVLVLNLGLPTFTYSRSTHYVQVDGDGVGGDGKQDEWVAPRPGYDPGLVDARITPSISFIWLLRQFVLRTIVSWF